MRNVTEQMERRRKTVVIPLAHAGWQSEKRT